LAPGSKSVTFTLTPIDDALPDNGETVVATLEPSAVYVVTPANGRAAINIRDGETPLMSLFATDAAASEQGLDGGAFVVRRTGPDGVPVTVNLETVGTA